MKDSEGEREGEKQQLCSQLTHTHTHTHALTCTHMHSHAHPLHIHSLTTPMLTVLDNLMYYRTIASLAWSHPTLVFWTCIHPYANRWQAAIAVQSFQQSRTSDDTNVTDVINSWTKNNNTVKYCAYGTTNNNPSPGKGEGPTWSHLHVLWLICSHMHSTLLYYFCLTFDLSLSLSLFLSRGTWHTRVRMHTGEDKGPCHIDPLIKKVAANPPPMTNYYVIFTLFMNKLLHYFYCIILIIIFHSITPYIRRLWQYTSLWPVFTP